MEADRDRLADSMAGELFVAMRDRGVGVAVEADNSTTALEGYLWSCNRARGLSVVMKQG